MYAVKCVNNGTSKDPFLTEVSEFAVLFGNELDAEVFEFIFNIIYVRITEAFDTDDMYCQVSTGVIDVDGSIYCSCHDH